MYMSPIGYGSVAIEIRLPLAKHLPSARYVYRHLYAEKTRKKTFGATSCSYSRYDPQRRRAATTIQKNHKFVLTGHHICVIMVVKVQ
jgi:hypothetical protein